MFGQPVMLRLFPALLMGLVLIGLTGCVHVPPPATEAQIRSLQTALVGLNPGVAEEDATIVAALAYDYPRELARQYHLVRPPLWHNLLINLHLKKRGLCYHWAEDLAVKLQSTGTGSLELHWGVARAGSWREHNTVVVTAPDQPFNTGIILDPWRHSGELFWGAVTNDTYPWREEVLLTTAPPAKSAAAASASR
jgi:hypothetical protein